jgi:polyphosphate kinase
VAQLQAVRSRVVELVAEHSSILRSVRGDLRREGIELVPYSKVPDDHAALRRRFLDEIHPVLTPLAVDPGHRFPYISTLTLSIAVGLRDPDTGARSFARVKVPPVLPRLLSSGGSRASPPATASSSTRSSRPTSISSSPVWRSRPTTFSG